MIIIRLILCIHSFFFYKKILVSNKCISEGKNHQKKNHQKKKSPKRFSNKLEGVNLGESVIFKKKKYSSK